MIRMEGKKIPQTPELRRSMIQKTLRDHCNNGDAYMPLDALYQRCLSQDHSLTKDVFQADLQALVESDFLCNDNGRIYSEYNWSYENALASRLAHLIQLPPMQDIEVPAPVILGEKITLTDEQQKAVVLALTNRISLVLGGAGTGKTTIIQAITELAGYHPWRQTLICSPTGKAVRNLTNHGLLGARTVHSALSIKATSEGGSNAISWDQIRLVVIDEVSMLSTALLAMLLNAMDDNCRLVLVGDAQQLPSIGAGNVIEDLCGLGIPHIFLTENHRLALGASSLASNVLHFDEIVSHYDLDCGNSFNLVSVLDGRIVDRIAEDAARRLEANQNVQVIVTHNRTAEEINNAIRDRINPHSPFKPEICRKTLTLRDGDRVIITQNDRTRGCYNGDIGTIRIQRLNKNDLTYSIVLPGGRILKWPKEEAEEQLHHLLLAYAITVHKAQGSEYDYVMMPVTEWMRNMLSRNLLYTAITRARKQMLLYGDPDAVDMALGRELPPRLSMVIPKTLHLMDKAS